MQVFFAAVMEAVFGIAEVFGWATARAGDRVLRATAYHTLIRGLDTAGPFFVLAFRSLDTCVVLLVYNRTA